MYEKYILQFQKDHLPFYFNNQQISNIAKGFHRASTFSDWKVCFRNISLNQTQNWTAENLHAFFSLIHSYTDYHNYAQFKWLHFFIETQNFWKDNGFRRQQNIHVFCLTINVSLLITIKSLEEWCQKRYLFISYFSRSDSCLIVLSCVLRIIFS